MAGGYTKIPKLQVVDLGTEGTGDRLALFDSDGKVVGYMMATDGFIPLSGTDPLKPITGDLEVIGSGNDLRIFSENREADGANQDNNQGIYFADGSMSIFNENIITGYVNSFNVSMNETYIGNSDPNSKGLFSLSFFNKQNDPKAFAQLGDIATGFESGYTTTDQVITATTDTIITLLGASFESDGGLNLIDGTSGKITPLLQGDILSIDIAMPLLTPVGTNEYCTMTLVLFGTSDVYRAITHQFIKGAGNQDYISVNWTVPIGADIITAGGLSIVINSTAEITIDSKYISVSRLHRTKN